MHCNKLNWLIESGSLTIGQDGGVGTREDDSSWPTQIDTFNRSSCHEKILIWNRASWFGFCFTFPFSVLSIISSAAVLHGWNSKRCPYHQGCSKEVGGFNLSEHFFIMIFFDNFMDVGAQVSPPTIVWFDLDQYLHWDWC